MNEQTAQSLRKFEYTCRDIGELCDLSAHELGRAMGIAQTLDLDRVTADDPRRVFEAPAEWVAKMRAKGLETFIGLRLIAI